LTFFVDRSLGRRIVPAALRDAGFAVVTHDEMFSDDTSDEEWLAEAGARGWVVLMKDDRIRYNPASVRRSRRRRFERSCSRPATLPARIRRGCWSLEPRRSRASPNVIPDRTSWASTRCDPSCDCSILRTCCGAGGQGEDERVPEHQIIDVTPRSKASIDMG
jgi:hypothetical protein